MKIQIDKKQCKKQNESYNKLNEVINKLVFNFFCEKKNQVNKKARKET